MPPIPSTCKAAVLTAPGSPLEITDVQVPDKLERDALLVKIDRATLCGTDVHVRDGAVAPRSDGTYPPIILGHEMTGRIVRFGAGPRTDSIGQPLAEGDRVVWSHGMCGRCANCVIEHQPTLCTNRRRYSSESCRQYPYLTGAFAEYGYVYPTSGRIRVPDEISDDVASASSCALRTVVQGFERLGPVAGHHTVVVQGSGPLGLFALAMAVTSNPAQVIVIGGPASRLELAREWGASHCVDVTEVVSAQDRHNIVKELTAGRGADVVIDMAGFPSAFSEGMAMLRAGGRYLVIGQAHSQTVPFNPTDIVLKQATLIGSRSAGIEHYWRALEFLRQHNTRFQWDRMISNTYPLAEINTAFDNMATGKEIKPVISMA
ncbi:zinc-binding dehydrogenase [Actinacidiphila glaucinigra]|uniref:zinc-binding dehydrogenase n=1 Tax=Actinacidiphila glaucinigra TaxID=235986 RepID=UPI00366AD834